MYKSHISLVANAVATAIQRVSNFGGILDEVTQDEAFKEMNERLNSENENVLRRLQANLDALLAVDKAEEEAEWPKFNSFDVFNISKAVNEKIMRLEEAQSYFSQMGEPEQIVKAVQIQIQGLTFALASLYEAQ